MLYKKNCALFILFLQSNRGNEKFRLPSINQENNDCDLKNEYNV